VALVKYVNARFPDSLLRQGARRGQCPRETSQRLTSYCRKGKAGALFQESRKEVCGYDSRPATPFHSQRIGELMVQLVTEALERSACHDGSKTESPEVEVFDEFTPKLKTSTYGSDEYKGYLEAMGEGLKHHYSVNRHHPEHFPNGVNDMTLVDLVEMLADWKAATERHDDGDIAKSLEIQRDRFGLSEQLVSIFRNTAEHFGWI
jgi:hypothetical protein